MKINSSSALRSELGTHLHFSFFPRLICISAHFLPFSPQVQLNYVFLCLPKWSDIHRWSSTDANERFGSCFVNAEMMPRLIWGCHVRHRNGEMEQRGFAHFMGKAYENSHSLQTLTTPRLLFLVMTMRFWTKCPTLSWQLRSQRKENAWWLDWSIVWDEASPVKPSARGRVANRRHFSFLPFFLVCPFKTAPTLQKTFSSHSAHPHVRPLQSLRLAK